MMSEDREKRLEDFYQRLDVEVRYRLPEWYAISYSTSWESPAFVHMDQLEDWILINMQEILREAENGDS